MIKNIFFISTTLLLFIIGCRRETKDHERCGCDDLKTSASPEKQDTLTLHAPKAFTPNGDGINDLFLPIIKDKNDLVFMRFEVFNRKRKKTYFSTIDNNTKGWDGKNADGVKLGTDIYAWTFSGTTNTGAKVQWEGEVLLFKNCYDKLQPKKCNFGDMIIPGQGFVIPTREIQCPE